MWTSIISMTISARAKFQTFWLFNKISIKKNYLKRDEWYSKLILRQFSQINY
jgi:hypothetical protein